MTALRAPSADQPADAAALIHEFNNVLARLLGASELLAENLTDPQGRDLARVCLESAERSGVLLTQLRARIEPLAPEAEPVACVEALEAAVGFARRVARGDVELHASAEAGLACLCDRAELEQALVILILDAVHAMPGGGVVLLDATPGRLPPGAARTVGLPGGFVQITVHHTGDAGGRFGLAAVTEFANRSGGGIAEAASTTGATVTLYLPLAA